MPFARTSTSPETQTALATTPPVDHHPRRWFLILLAVVCGAELAVRALVHFILPPDISVLGEALTHVLALTALAAPLLWLLGVRARRSSVAREHRWAEARIRTLDEQHRLLNALLRADGEDTPLDDILQRCLDAILEVRWLPLRPEGGIFLVEDDPQVLVLKAHRNLPPELREACARVPFGHCLCGRAATSGEIQFASRLADGQTTPCATIAGRRSYSIPIRSNNRTLGAIILCLDEEHQRQAAHEEFLEAAANAIARLIERKRAEQTLKEQAAALQTANLELEAQKQQLRAQQLDLEAANRDLRLASAQAQAANRAKSEFLANMSHEIRTPITGILGYAETLLETDLSEAERIDAIETIRRNGRYLIDIINDILDLSKIEAGKLALERVSCSPGRIMAEVAALLRARAERKGLRLEVGCDGPIPEAISTDPTRLRQILINLVGNAIKFSEVGKISLTAGLATGAGRTPLMQFDVTDTGVGLTAQQATELFQPFTQADSSATRRFGGTGLGLTISQRLAQILGGDVYLVESRRGAGSRFRATVSAGSLEGVRMIDPSCATTMLRVADPPPRVAASGTELNGCRILLAEDGPDNQRLIARILTRAGATVTVVENGRLALERALEARAAGTAFDAILMDMQMPELDGYEAASRLRQADYVEPIIALTAHAMRGDREKCLQAGCDHYITKPIERAELIATIQHLTGVATPGGPAQ